MVVLVVDIITIKSFQNDSYNNHIEKNAHIDHAISLSFDHF
jgi:hypothetical protein